MDLMYELLWRGGPVIIAAVILVALAYWSIGQTERKAKRKP